MNITLWNNKSDTNVVHKDLELLGQLSLDLQIEKPLLDMEITTPKSEITFNENMINYITVTDFNRDYFVKEIVKSNAGIIIFRLHEDVLSTHFDKIKNIDAWILRQEHKANLYVDDDEIIVQNRSDQVVLKFPNTFGVDSNGAPVGTNVMLVLGSAQIIKE